MNCRYCGKPVVGAKNDWWHTTDLGTTGSMTCEDKQNTAFPDKNTETDDGEREFEDLREQLLKKYEHERRV